MDSFRRQKINKLILMNIKFINGEVLDIGGTNNTKTILKSFLTTKTNIKTLNKNKNFQADILADFDYYKNFKKKYDTLLSFELLEYLEYPKDFFNKAYRLLKPKGHMILSIPFLNPIHGDKLDNYRITKKKLIEIIKKEKFKIIKFHNVGSVGTVINDIIRASCGYASKCKKGKISIFLLFIFKWFFNLLDYLTQYQSEFINSGYFIILRKK
tara:strand:- start:2435 stop:3070 length:636 start_codon:yes stop_codon:yes gene_type:complete